MGAYTDHTAFDPFFNCKLVVNVNPVVRTRDHAGPGKMFPDL